MTASAEGRAAQEVQPADVRAGARQGAEGGGMKERPILFSAPIVRAILSGSKSQTRRALHPDAFISSGGAIVRMVTAGLAVTGIREERCPYWRTPGDRLWVREAWRAVWSADNDPPRSFDATYRFWYEADAPLQDGYGKLRPSIHMPRCASRLMLDITGVRVERLQEISEEDAIAEGVEWFRSSGVECPGAAETPIAAYRALWEIINGEGSWSINPLVWVIEFKRVEAGNA